MDLSEAEDIKKRCQEYIELYEKMSTIKNINSMDLQKQKILRRGGKNTQKNDTKKDLHEPDNHDGVITHLESDILECKVKRALGRLSYYEQS